MGSSPTYKSFIVKNIESVLLENTLPTETSEKYEPLSELVVQFTHEFSSVPKPGNTNVWI
jgi:hypothetical protein